jgi:hypothetical protein
MTTTYFPVGSFAEASWGKMNDRAKQANNITSDQPLILIMRTGFLQ